MGSTKGLFSSNIDHFVKITAAKINVWNEAMLKQATIFAVMKILIAAATAEEISILKEIDTYGHEIDFLITGIGMVPTAYMITRQFAASEYDLAINIGLAGSFDRSLEIGEVVRVEVDHLSEVGAEDGDNFLTLEEMGLEGLSSVSMEIDYHSDTLNSLPVVSGITVNTVHGNEASIEKIVHRLNPSIETMEGAAFLFVCKREKTMAIQLRSISNYIEKRNRENWNIELALSNLHRTIIQILQEITE